MHQSLQKKKLLRQVLSGTMQSMLWFVIELYVLKGFRSHGGKNKWRHSIEEMFGDMKGHGFDLESTHLRNFLRLSRLTLMVVLLYVWLLSFGSRIIKSGQRRLVDRNDRRDYSLFRIGWHMADRRLINEQPFQISFTFSI